MLAFAPTLVRDGPATSERQLLPLKLTPAPLRAGVLLRPDLQALLSEARLQPLTLVVAPAGYGKTTLLAQWVQDLQRTGASVCWLTLDSGDRDPALFLAYLIRTFQSAFPGIGADAWRVLNSAANLDRDWPLVAGALCSELQRKLPTATFLFLDDLHLVADAAVIGQILGYILRAVPPTLHVIASSRRAPTFAPLGRLRAEGRLLEVLQRDLHLNANDARQILAAQNIQLSEEELALLLNRTEGWMLSVQLAARALAAQPAEQRGAFVRALGGSQEQLLDYLSVEVLADLPPEILDFLRVAAIPAYFDAALLTEVLLREDVSYLLQRSQSLGLPILPLDDQGGRLRFHTLWRELLLRGLDTTVDHETLSALHRRFGRAFEVRGNLEASLEHYAAAGASDDLVRALRDNAWPLLQSPRRDMVRRWLEELPAPIREEDADLLYMWGYSQMIADPDLAATTIEQAAELFRQSGSHTRELRALSDLAALLFWQMRPTRFAAVALRAVRAANHVRDDWSRGAALVCVSAMLYAKGRDLAALRVARQAAAQPLNPAWHWLLTMIVATINVRLGSPAEALADIDRALKIPQIDNDDRLRQHLLRLRAMARYQQGHLAEATTMALDAHRLLGDYYAITGFSAQQLGLLLTLQGRVDEATTYINQARAAFHELGALAPLATLQAIELYSAIARGQAARVASSVTNVLRRLDEAEGNSPDLGLRLLLILVLGEGGEPRQALTLAQELARDMRARGYRMFLAVTELYIAYLAGQVGENDIRQASLKAGWQLATTDQLLNIPLLPTTALRDVADAALRGGIEPEMVGRVLCRQIPEIALDMFLKLLDDPTPLVREHAARLLGDLGAAVAYPALRGLLKDRNAAVRRAADDALSRLVYRPPYRLFVRTLGAFTIWRGDQEVRDRDWRSSKARQLFQLLLTERGRTLPRDRILDALWPDMEPEPAANNLRVTINRLSKALEPDRPDGAPPAYLVQQGDTCGLNPASDLQVDAVDFAAAVEEGQLAAQRGQRQAAMAALKRAISFYGGPYLPDNMYEDWTVVERERLALLFNEAAMSLGGMLLEEGQSHDAIGLAWRVLEHDRAYEDAYRLLMRAHAALGERSTALRLYARCVSVLHEELGVEPLPETTALYNALRA